MQPARRNSGIQIGVVRRAGAKGVEEMQPDQLLGCAVALDLDSGLLPDLTPGRRAVLEQSIKSGQPLKGFLCGTQRVGGSMLMR